MRNRIKGIFVFVCACAFSCFLLVAAGYFYLDRRVKETKQTASDVPYEFALPEEKSILLQIGENKTALYLDFPGKTLYVTHAQTESDLTAPPFSGAFDYTLRADQAWLVNLVDALGGITLTVSGEPLRYTGMQVSELVGKAADNEWKRAIAEATVQKIAETGLTVGDCRMIIEESETDLNLSDCVLWLEAVPELFANAVFTGFQEQEAVWETEKAEK